METKKRILIGTEFFEKLIEDNYFYIDKTLFIKELIDKKGEVSLFTRPRRFGKTLALTTLQCFFDIQQKRKDLFDGLMIMEYHEIIERYQNKYPLVFITLKDVVSSRYAEAIVDISSLIEEIFQNNYYLYESGKLNEHTKKRFDNYCSGDVSEANLSKSLKFFSQCLYTYHQKKVIILIDEYDTPINNALEEGYYPQMIKFMRGFLGSMFKSNPYLEFGVLTGVQRVAKESLFSSFNNPKINGIMDEDFLTCFGFTETEVREACEIYTPDVKYDEVKKWYNGYRFGDQDIYNPWSITRFLDSNRFDNYWVHTGGLSQLKNIFVRGSDVLKDKMADLLLDVPILIEYTDEIVYPVIYDDENAFWSMLLNAGYIKPCLGATLDNLNVELVNNEVRKSFARCIREWFHETKTDTPDTIREFVDDLLNGKIENVRDTLNNELLNNPSCHDFKAENSYHMFLFGILLTTAKEYTIVSNAESGKGRADLMIKPLDKAKPAIILELKHIKRLPKNTTPTDLVIEGMQQIEDKKYAYSLKNEGYNVIYAYSICFHQKNCEMEMR